MSRWTRSGGILTAIGILSAVTATPALAGVPALWSFNNVCGGNTFQTCASGWLAAGDDGSGHTVILISVTNEGNYASVFKAVGLINMPAGTSVSFTGGSAMAAGWSGEPPSDLSGGGLPEGTYGSISPNPAPSNGLMVGSTLEFEFTFNRTLTSQEIAQLGIGVHGISGPNGCSTKLGILPDGEGGGEPVLQGPYDENCTGGSTVPEPITMALLGTGLLGIAGVARRRREGEIVEDDETA